MVSSLGFGCMRLPMLPDAQGDMTKIDVELSVKLIHHAIENGVTYFDTAYTYHSNNPQIPGESEPLLARALRGGYREKVKIATKLPSWLINSREDMDKYLNHQLERLETDHIDFYLIHNVQQDRWANLMKLGITDFLDSALKDGRIKHAGFSFHDTAPFFKEVVDAYDWSFCQIMYNYLDESFQAGTEGLDYAHSKGLGIAIMEPLRGGMLAGKLPPKAKEAFDETGIERTPAAWALKWLWNNPKISVVLSGMNAMSQLEENIRTATETEANSMPAEELAAVDRAKTAIKSGYKIGCTQCHYCSCPVGVEIPTCFTIYNNFYLYGEDQSYKRMYGAMLSDAGRRASSCIECGTCESHCPQQIAIPEELKKVRQLFEG